MSNLVTKNCDHKSCEKLYHNDSNNWWWAYRKGQVILFGMFHTAVIINSANEVTNKANDIAVLDKDSIVVLHFCGQEHLMSWVNENVGRIIESQAKPSQEETVRSV